MNKLEVTKLKKNFRVLVDNTVVDTYLTMQRARTAANVAVKLSDTYKLNLKVRIEEITAEKN